MSEMMVRKQIYLPRKQNLLLKRVAKQRGVSEAEVIRQALEREMELMAPAIQASAAAWDRILSFVEERKATFAGQGQPVRWDRQELYEERENRWDKRIAEE